MKRTESVVLRGPTDLKPEVLNVVVGGPKTPEDRKDQDSDNLNLIRYYGRRVPEIERLTDSTVKSRRY